MSTVAKRWTYDDLVALPEDNLRHEILDGEHFVVPSPLTKHQRLTLRLAAALFAHTEAQGVGEVFVAPFDVVFSPDNVVEPDILYVSRPRAGIVTERNVQGAPDLVIEILSESTRRRDELQKRKIYERYGVAEYWIVDPEIDAVKVYRRGAAGYDAPLQLSVEGNDTLTTPLLPGFSLALATFFAFNT